MVWRTKVVDAREQTTHHKAVVHVAFYVLRLITPHNFLLRLDSLLDIVWQWQGALM